MNACQPRDAKEIVADILAIEEAITAMLEEAKGTSVAGIMDVFKREDEMRAEMAELQKQLPTVTPPTPVSITHEDYDADIAPMRGRYNMLLLKAAGATNPWTKP